MKPAVAATDLACAAGIRTLFSGLSFEVPAGRWLALTGPNGTGKTTLLRALAGLVRPTAGEVRWQGAPRVVGSPAWHAACLFQGHSAGWKDGLTVTENLCLQRELDDAGTEAAADAGTWIGTAGVGTTAAGVGTTAGTAAADGRGAAQDEEDRSPAALLARVGLARQARLPFGRLSAGQRRRLSLARMAASRRPLWLLDEPTTALDAAGQALFGELLDAHLARGGLAIVATHQTLPVRESPIELSLGDFAAR